MIDKNLYYIIVYIWIAYSIAALPFLLLITAPYGRHSSEKWGPMISNKAGWIIMEWTVPVVFLFFFFNGTNVHTPVSWIFFSLWALHYANRSFLFPFRQKSAGKKIPVVIVFFGIFYNFMNSFIVGHYFGSICTPYSIDWIQDPRFITGFIIFFIGLTINWWSDNILLNLRKPGEVGYKIPFGGFFRFVSCPNHFGEIVEWLGFALMAWALPVLAFSISTVSNLIPRAIHHHRWYKKKFNNYPDERKAVIPLIM